MKFSRLFFLENLKKNFSKTGSLMFFKFQPMTAKHWFSLRMDLKKKGVELFVLKKRELYKFLNIENDKFSLDSDNVCFGPIVNLNFFLKNFDAFHVISDVLSLRPFLLKANSQLLTINYLKNLFLEGDYTSSRIFYNNFMFLPKSFYYLSFNFISIVTLNQQFKNLNLKE